MRLSTKIAIVVGVAVLFPFGASRAQEVPPQPPSVLVKRLEVQSVPGDVGTLFRSFIDQGARIDRNGNIYSRNFYSVKERFGTTPLGSIFERVNPSGQLTPMSPIEESGPFEPCPPPPQVCVSTLSLLNWDVSENGTHFYYSPMRVDETGGGIELPTREIRSISINNGAAESDTLYDLKANGYDETVFAVNNAGRAFAVLRRPGTTVPDFAFISPAGQKFNLPIPKDTYNPDLNYISVDINNLGTAFLVTGNSPAGSPIYIFNPNLSPRLKVVGLKSPGAQVTQRAFFGSDITTPEHPEGILFYSEGANQKVVGTDGSVLVNFESSGSTIDRFAMNNSRQCIVSLRSPFGATVALNGPDLIANRIIGSGDLLDGKIVSEVLAQSINENGQYAIHVRFLNSTSAVYANQSIQRDIRAVGVRLAQAVFDPDANGDGKVDLIRGKTAAALISIDGIVIDDMLEPNEIKGGARLYLNNQLVKEVSDIDISTVISKFRSGETGGEIPIDFIPQSSGEVSYRVDLVIEPSFSDSIAENNSISGKFGSNVTRDLVLHFTEIVECKLLTCQSRIPMTKLREYIDVASRFTNAILPIRDGGVIRIGETNTPMHESHIGDFWDFFSIWRRAKKSGSHAELAIGIVTPEYMISEFGIEGTGVTNGFLFDAIMVTNNSYDALPHELGHAVAKITAEEYDPLTGEFNPSFGYPQGFNSHWLVDPTLADKVSGLLRPDQPWIEGLNRQPNHTLHNIMGPGGIGIINTWIRRNTYEKFMQKLSSNFVDPEVILIAGYFDPTEKVVMMPADIVDAGDLTPAVPGPYSLVFLDSNGRQVFETTFNATSEFSIAPKGKIRLNYAPFGIVAPYMEVARELVVQKNGATIYRANLIAKTLRDAIDSVPDRAFQVETKASLERRLLQKTVDLIDKSYLLPNNAKSTLALLNVLRKEVLLWVRKDFSSLNTNEYNQAMVIAVIDRYIASAKKDVKASCNNNPDCK